MSIVLVIRVTVVCIIRPVYNINKNNHVIISDNTCYNFVCKWYAKTDTDRRQLVWKDVCHSRILQHDKASLMCTAAAWL